MEDGIHDEKVVDLADVREALLSSSTKRRRTWLATLHQQIKDSGMSPSLIVWH